MATEILIQANNFSKRSDLEKHIMSKHGLTTTPKDTEIIGTTSDLKALNLSHGSSFWGMKCVDTSYIQKKTVINTVDRGPKTKFGVNGDKQDSTKIIKKD